jgi:hypothetical protein
MAKRRPAVSPARSIGVPSISSSRGVHDGRARRDVDRDDQLAGAVGVAADRKRPKPSGVPVMR